MDIPHNTSIQDRQSIIAQAAARGLQISEDGQSWVPINPKTNKIPSKHSNAIIVNKGSFDNLVLIYFFVSLGLVGFFLLHLLFSTDSGGPGSWIYRLIYG